MQMIEIQCRVSFGASTSHFLFNDGSNHPIRFKTDGCLVRFSLGRNISRGAQKQEVTSTEAALTRSLWGLVGSDGIGWNAATRNLLFLSESVFDAPQHVFT